MKRLLALALGLATVGAGRAAEPNPSPWLPPPTVWTGPGAVRQAQATAPTPMPGVPAPVAAVPAAPAMAPASPGVTDPLPAVLGTLPTTPTVPAVGCADGCATGRPTAGPAVARRRIADGSFLNCFSRWVRYQPGPPVLPCEPARPHAPVRSFFPCGGGAGGTCGPAGCAPGTAAGSAAGCATGACSGGACGDSLLGGGGCSAPHPLSKGLGHSARPSRSVPTTGPIEAATRTVGVPLPAACVGGGPLMTAPPTAGESMLTRAFNRVTPVQAVQTASTVPTSIVPTVVGYARPGTVGYRFADATQSAAAPKPATPAAPLVRPAAYAQPTASAAQPFTRP